MMKHLPSCIPGLTSLCTSSGVDMPVGGTNRMERGHKHVVHLRLVIYHRRRESWQVAVGFAAQGGNQIGCSLRSLHRREQSCINQQELVGGLPAWAGSTAPDSSAPARPLDPLGRLAPSGSRHAPRLDPHPADRLNPSPPRLDPQKPHASSLCIPARTLSAWAG